MSLANDVILDTNEWIDIIIHGSATYSIVGLQNRLYNLFPNKGIVVEFANNSYLLPMESNYGRELEKPFVAISSRFKINKNMYWKDKLPKSEDIGWSEDLDIRFDVWGRTPPETRDVADGTWNSLKVLRRQIWVQTRTKMEVEGDTENYVDKLEGVPDLWHRNVNTVLTIFKTKEVD
jgi:hypothetical protein